MRTAIALVLASCLLGCGPREGELAPAGEAVALTTGEGFFPTGLGCFLYDNHGRLVVDPKYGTAAEGGWVHKPLIWPLGFTARRLPEGEVVVLNVTGQIVAVTGRQYTFYGRAWTDDDDIPFNVDNPECVVPA